MTAPDVVLVTGPPRAGVTSLVGELRSRMPNCRFVEPGDAGHTGPLAMVLFVVSAVAPITESDCALAALATAATDAVVAVVSKIDDHRDWTAVLAADRARLAAHTPRLAPIPWIGVAAAPRLGDPVIDELVRVLGEQLADPGRAGRNQLRAWAAREQTLRDERDRLMRERRAGAARRATLLRTDLAQARLTVTHTARKRCAALRTELLDDAAAAGRGDVNGFADRARRRAAEVLAAVDADLTAHAHAEADGPAAAPDEPWLPDPPLRARRLEIRLMTVLGAGFGLGVAMVVPRLLSGLAPELATVGLLAGTMLGLVTTAWVIRTRALLHDRSVLERWALEVVAALRVVSEERVATRMLAVETALAAAGAASGDAEDAVAGARIAQVEAALRELSRARQRRIGHHDLLPLGRSPGGNHLNRSCE
ncbi:hypothetical protein [Mycobacterium sp. ZZG]